MLNRVLLITPYPDHFRNFLEPDLVDALHYLKKDVFSLVWEKQKNLADALKNYSALKKTITEFSPDTVLVFNVLDLHPLALKFLTRRLRCQRVFWFIDSPIARDNQPKRLNEYRHYSAYFQSTVWPDHFETLKKQGFKHVFGLPLAANTPITTPVSEPNHQHYGADITSVGTYYERGGRAGLLNRVYETGKSKKWDCKFWGTTELPIPEGLPFTVGYIDRETIYNIYQSSKICLQIPSQTHVPFWFNDNYYLIPGAGGFCLCRYIEGLETLYQNHEHVVWFHDEAEALELIEYYLAHEPARQKIARQGQQLVHEKHLYPHRIREMEERMRDSATR